MSERKGSNKTRAVREALVVPGDGVVVSAADFKARCLQLMDRVQQERSEVVVTRYGRPVAKLVPYEEEPASPLGWLRGTVTMRGDIVAPLDESWDADA
ncbi:MAG TPA: type II toxin-antitoxin system Phd/YefM family antitoxin [Longimicrobiaceae bacterium]|nr:type II toxin-antitoxin system Phd/YefM family antitoxin [Longimicrobiaceae bacterium]